MAQLFLAIRNLQKRRYTTFQIRAYDEIMPKGISQGENHEYIY